ncbi:hypothetical protein niasHT_004627 [Heterodera trifolii]|uniref:COP9 signalosome complex subunit 3 N-terminal helical repeats domain-containing protein n=1 Tax=Heterodera trifolii TaxID=157864 RepID=A0ABD2M7E8_9BILA
MVNTSAFFNAVQNLTCEASSKELAQFCRRWLDENAEKVNATEADRLVGMINLQTHTLGAICTLYVKLIKIRSDAELRDFLANLYEQLPFFDLKQIHWALDIYNRFFENITDILLKRKVPLWGILLLERAILICSQGHANRLTNLHASFFCLCLKARHFDRAVPFLHIDVVELFKRADGAATGASVEPGADGSAAAVGGSVSDGGDKVSSSEKQQAQSSSTGSGIASLLQKAMNTVSGGGAGQSAKFEEPKTTTQSHNQLNRRSVLLSFYYGALIYAALEQWEESALFLEHVICFPVMKKNSAIALDALKKYNIIWLILGRSKPIDSLPHYRLSVLQRNFVALASVYTKLWPLMQRNMDNKTDLVHTLFSYLNEKYTVFDRDRNVGLMKVLINVCRENAIKRLGNIFVSLQLDDVNRMAHLGQSLPANSDEMENAEQIIMRLRHKSPHFVARIDGRTQTVFFEEEAKSSKQQMAAQLQNKVGTAMADVITLASIVHSYEDAVRLNTNYVEKCAAQKEKLRGAGGNGGGSSSSMTFDDEGLFGGGSP